VFFAPDLDGKEQDDEETGADTRTWRKRKVADKTKGRSWRDIHFGGVTKEEAGPSGLAQPSGSKIRLVRHL